MDVSQGRLSDLFARIRYPAQLEHGWGWLTVTVSDTARQAVGEQAAYVFKVEGEG